MAIPPGLLQLARFRLHWPNGASSKVDIVGRTVGYPLMVIVVFAIPSWPQSWFDAMMYVTIVFGVISVVHAFLVRKEYLLRLDLKQRETSHMSSPCRFLWRQQARPLFRREDQNARPFPE
jgi:hypothetical protein